MHACWNIHVDSLPTKVVFENKASIGLFLNKGSEIVFGMAPW